MSVKSKRFFKKLISHAGIFFFVLAIGMLYWQLRRYAIENIGPNPNGLDWTNWELLRFALRKVAQALWNIPFINLVLACAACLFGYIALSLYDYLALDYVGRKVSWWKWMLAGMLGFAISNNAGHAVVSGGAIRYRLYTRWRVPASDIVKMITFSGLTFFLGYAAMAAIGYFLVPKEIIANSAGISFGVNTVFIVCLSIIFAYYAITVMFHKKSIRIKDIKFHIPSISEALLQTFLGLLDALCAGLVLYFCLRPYVNISFGVFIGLYVIANMAGVFSQVPGGIGVFEAFFMQAMPEDANSAGVLGAILAYRIIYYVLPLIGVGGLFFVYERWLRARMKRWLEEAKQRMPHISLSHKKHNLGQ